MEKWQQLWKKLCPWVDAMRRSLVKGRDEFCREGMSKTWWRSETIVARRQSKNLHQGGVGRCLTETTPRGYLQATNVYL
eukprot:scaffold45937_cov350-Skeletonema_marinoi.AAC.1